MTVAEHPLIDGAVDGWVATETRAEVVSLGVGVSDFVHRVAALLSVAPHVATALRRPSSED